MARTAGARPLETRRLTAALGFALCLAGMDGSTTCCLPEYMLAESGNLEWLGQAKTLWHRMGHHRPWSCQSQCTFLGLLSSCVPAFILCPSHQPCNLFSNIHSLSLIQIWLLCQQCLLLTVCSKRVCVVGSIRKTISCVGVIISYKHSLIIY